MREPSEGVINRSAILAADRAFPAALVELGWSAKAQHKRLVIKLTMTNTANLAAIVQRGWKAVGTGDFDALVADYVEDMRFFMPGQTNLLEGRQAFRAALDSLAKILPPKFEITGLRQLQGENEVVSIVEWKSEKVAGSQLSVLFKFRGDKIYEERWFIDTEQWKSAF